MTLKDDQTSAEELQISFSAWSVEGADLVLLGMDADAPEPNDLMNFCRAVLGTLALDADAVVFVVAGDFAESVKRRLPEGEYKDAFDLERGAGTVAAKTMRVDDEIHVVFPAWMFVDLEAARKLLTPEQVVELEDTTADRVRLTRRTAIHEAQHVAMEQSGESVVDLAGRGFARKNFLNVAAQVIDEYRAELAVPEDLRGNHETKFPVDSLDHLRRELTRITTIEYQQHLDVGRLAYDVGQQSNHAWKALAYLAAARRAAGIELGDPFDDSVTKAEAWTRMVAPFWDRFETLLAEIPSGSVRVDRTERQRWIEDLADLLDEWLQGYGFRWLDAAGDNSQFLIQSWDLFV